MVSRTALSLVASILSTVALAQGPLSDEDETTYLVVGIIIAVTSYVAFIVSFFSDSFTYVETSFMAVILYSTCSYVSEGPAKMVDYIKYFISPFIDLDAEIAILCNIGLIVFVFAIHLVASKLAQKSASHGSFSETMGAMYFPSVGMVLISHLFCGTALLSVGVFAKLNFNSSIDIFQLISSCIGMVFVCVVCVIWVLSILSTDLSYKPHKTVNFFSPSGFYDPPTSRTAYRNLVGMVRDGGAMRLFLLSPLVISMAMAIFFSIPSEDMGCTTRFSIVVALVGLQFIALLVLRPLRSLGLSLTSAVAHIGLILLMVATLIEVKDNATSDTAKWLRIAGAGVVAICQITAIFAQIAIGCTETYPAPVIGEREPFTYRF